MRAYSGNCIVQKNREQLILFPKNIINDQKFINIKPSLPLPTYPNPNQSKHYSDAADESPTPEYHGH